MFGWIDGTQPLVPKTIWYYSAVYVCPIGSSLQSVAPPELVVFRLPYTTPEATCLRPCRGGLVRLLSHLRAEGTSRGGGPVPGPCRTSCHRPGM